MHRTLYTYAIARLWRVYDTEILPEIIIYILLPLVDAENVVFGRWWVKKKIEIYDLVKPWTATRKNTLHV